MNETNTIEPENQVPKEDRERRAKTFPVMEIFGPTVQGEGLTIGQRTIFIRFGICDYRCGMCDSMHAVDPKSVHDNARRMTADEIFEEVERRARLDNCGWITLSGGNPCVHDLTQLIGRLRDANLGITVETQGTIWQNWLNTCDYVTVSPKGPGMQEKFEILKFRRFMDRLAGHPGSSVKVVVFDARDFEFASMIAEICKLWVGSDRFYLSQGNPNPPPIHANPEFPSDIIPIEERIQDYIRFIDDIKDYRSLTTARILPQLHTWLWGNAKGR